MPKESPVVPLPWCWLGGYWWQHTSPYQVCRAGYPVRGCPGQAGQACLWTGQTGSSEERRREEPRWQICWELVWGEICLVPGNELEKHQSKIRTDTEESSSWKMTFLRGEAHIGHALSHKDSKSIAYSASAWKSLLMPLLVSLWQLVTYTHYKHIFQILNFTWTKKHLSHNTKFGTMQYYSL